MRAGMPSWETKNNLKHAYSILSISRRETLATRVTDRDWGQIRSSAAVLTKALFCQTNPLTSQREERFFTWSTLSEITKSPGTFLKVLTEMFNQMLSSNRVRCLRLYRCVSFLCHQNISKGLSCCGSRHELPVGSGNRSLVFLFSGGQGKKVGSKQKTVAVASLSYASPGQSPCVPGIVTALGGPSQQHRPSLLLILLRSKTDVGAIQSTPASLRSLPLAHRSETWSQSLRSCHLLCHLH